VDPQCPRILGIFACKPHHRFNMGGIIGEGFALIRPCTMATTMQGDSAIKKQSVLALYIQPTRGGRRAPIRPAQFNASHNIASCGDVRRAAPSVIAGKGRGRFQNFYNRAKPDRPIQKLEPISCGREKAKTAPPVGFWAGTSWVSAGKDQPIAPCACP